MSSLLLKGKKPQNTLPFFLRTLNLYPDFKPAPVIAENSNMPLEHYNKAIGYYAKAGQLDPQWALVFGTTSPLASTDPPGIALAQRTANSTGEHEIGLGDKKFAHANRRGYQ